MKIIFHSVFIFNESREFKALPIIVNQLLQCIFDSFLKNLNILTCKLLKSFPPYQKVDHKIEVVPRLASLSKTPYRLNQKEFFKCTNKWPPNVEYIKQNKPP
jgi:hypothetical protein